MSENIAFSNVNRKENLQKVAKEVYDLVVIGGGITGAGIALDASSRGMKVLLLEGQIEVHIQEDGQKKTMKLGPGDMYLHPAKVPHSPARQKGSIGLVVERKRVDLDAEDGLLWFCDNCNHKLYEVYFKLNDIEKDFLGHFKHFYGSEELRTCDNCGTVMPVDERFIAKEE